MAQWLSQAVLPWVLAGVMLAMGLSLTWADFQRVAYHPRRVFVGLGLQILALPILAWIVVLTLPLLGIPLSPIAMAGVLLVALVPGGATSNLFSYLVQGDLALSMTLTALTAMLIPFTLPVLMALNFHFLGMTAAEIQLPYWSTVGQLLLVTVLPALLGMWLRRRLPASTVQVWLPRVRLLTGIAMVSMVLALFVAYYSRLPALWSPETLAVLLLCILGMLVGDRVARAIRLPQDSVRTITVEVGVQNAGVAMMVAFAILQMPPLGLVPLLYGLMMNVPVFLWVFFLWWRDRQRVLDSVPERP